MSHIDDSERKVTYINDKDEVCIATLVAFKMRGVIVEKDGEEFFVDDCKVKQIWNS